MTTRENMSGQSFVNSVAPATAPSTSQTGATVDTLGFDSATMLVNVGIGGITFTGSNRIDFLMEHSDDGATWTGVAQSDVLASPGTTVTVGTGGIVRSLIAAKAAADAQPFKIGYAGSKRYLRGDATFGGTHGSGTPLTILFALAHAHNKPVA